MDILNSINAVVVREVPDRFANGYRIWFREYLPSFENDMLVGIALAWPPSRDGPYAFCVAGPSTPQQYERGQKFDLGDPAMIPTHRTTEAEFVRLAKGAMDALEAYVVAGMR